MAKLYFRYSPMNSGKSLALLQAAHNYTERDMRVLLLTSAVDTRTGEGVISTRLGLSSPALTISTVQDIFAVDLAVQLEDISAVFVDESQFLSPDVIDKLSDIVDNHNIPVFCYGLKSDFKSELFPGSKRLMELADSISELKSICACGRKAIMNARLGDSQEQIVLGTEDQYITVCRKCFKERFKK